MYHRNIMLFQEIERGRRISLADPTGGGVRRSRGFVAARSRHIAGHPNRPPSPPFRSATWRSPLASPCGGSPAS